MDKQRQKYKGLLDMIDGGGAGAVGNEFEGGGLLSVLANAFATPLGSSDRMRDAMQEQRPMGRPAGGFGNGSIDSVASSLRPQVRPVSESLQLSPLEMFGGQQPAEYSRPVQGSGVTPANNYVSSSDPYAYSGDREEGMAGNVPTPGRYDYGLPDDANDFSANPNVSPNPFAGTPGVGGDGRSPDGQILQNAPAGLLNAPLQDAAPSELQTRKFVQQIYEKYPDRADEILRSPSLANIINYYVRNRVLPVIGPASSIGPTQ